MGDAATVDLRAQGDAPIREHRSSSDPAPSHSFQGNGPQSSDAGVKSESESARSSASNGLTKAIAAVKDRKDSLNSNKGCSPASSNPRLKASRSNFTVPQPFSLTTEKRATLAGSSAGSKPAGNGAPTPTRSQKVVTKRVESPAQCTKSTGSLKIGTPSPIGSTTPRSKAEFIFKSDERAQKRMEFYANLNEKSKAREAERSRIQANTQQQMAAEIKRLRKDQTFKATPMPKFYHEPPPVRIDVKKTPPTRPKSPKLGRRGSSDAAAAAAKIIARRSSDEYQVVSNVSSDPSFAEAADIVKVEQEAPKSAEELTQEQQSLHDFDHEGSEHSSSRKSDQIIPKAALSEEDEDHHHPAAAAAAAYETGSGSAKENLAAELGSRGSGQSSLAEDFEGMLQLPVSSSLLEEGEEELGSDFENDHHDLDPEDEFASPGSQDQEEHEEQQNVRVYISEEFRQAAAAAAAQDHSQGDHEEQEEEEEFDEENDLDAANPRVFVNLDGLITKSEDQEVEEEEEEQQRQQ